MRLTAPIYVLKRRAKHLSRSSSVSLGTALKQIALQEGYASWSLLAARYAQSGTTHTVFQALGGADMVLLAARPGHGKTVLALDIALHAVQSGARACFFTLEYTEEQVRALLADSTDFDVDALPDFSIDTSDAISADYVMNRFQDAKPGSVAVIDYLQLLDQDRRKPPLSDQIQALRRFSKDRQITVVFIAQVDRRFEATGKDLPDIEDIRLPNPLDIALFSKMIFLNKGHLSLRDAA